MKIVASLAACLVALSVSATALADEKDCAVVKAAGLTEAEATAVEDVACAAVRERAQAGSVHRIRVSSMGGRIVLTVARARGAGFDERQAVLTGIDEIAVAAPRLVEALEEEKLLAETQSMTNIIAAEARIPKKKASEMHAALGVIGVGAFSGGAQGGAQFSFTVGSPSLSFVGDLRVAGDVVNDLAKGFSLGIVELSKERTLGYASASSGARHHFSDKDFSPFVGVGLALDAISISGDGAAMKNSGVAGYIEIGMDVLRTSTFGGTIGLRVDAPTFQLRGHRLAEDGSKVPTQAYAPIAAAAFALRF